MSTEIEAHQPHEDPDGLAIRCSCGSWAMLHRNILGKDAAEAFRAHQAAALGSDAPVDLAVEEPALSTPLVDLIAEESARSPEFAAALKEALRQL
jgi:hypothetical protein